MQDAHLYGCHNRKFKVILWRTTQKDETTTEIAADTTETITETTADTTETVSVTTETTTETICKLIRKNPKITAKEIASQCGITEDGVAYHIKKLKLAGKIVRIGGSRNGGEWKVMI